MERDPRDEAWSQPVHSLLPAELVDVFNDKPTVVEIATGQATVRLRELYSDRSLDTAEILQTRLAGLIDVAALDDNGWGQDERDAVVVVAGTVVNLLVSHAEVDHKGIVNKYADVVRTLPAGGDYFGPPHTMYELGEVLAGSMGQTTDAALSYHTRMQVRDAWSTYFGASQDAAAKTLAKPLVEGLTDRFLPYMAPENSQDAWRWSRQEPEMEADTQRLHDDYIREARARMTYKTKLFAATPDFQHSLAEQGLELVRYWNTHDPDQTAAAVAAWPANQSLSKYTANFDTLLAAKTGYSLNELKGDATLAKVLADQVHSAADTLKATLRVDDAPAEATIERLLVQAIDSQTARRPARKLKPVIHFLQTHGIDVASGMSADAVLDLFSNKAVLEQISASLAVRDGEREHSLQQLEALFPESDYKNLRLMNRDEADMYAGDDTRDCTAYHLENGFNAWTVPHWLANPGFNMAYIIDGGVPLAKLGMVLAQDEAGLRLVVDSIETSSRPMDKSKALISIANGIMELQDWADRCGLGDVIFCTLTNSSELTMELPVTEPAVRPQSLTQIGTDGLQELWQVVSGGAGNEIGHGYLQSSTSERNDLQFIRAEDVQGGLDPDTLNAELVKLEKELVRYMTPALATAARQGDLESIFVEYVKSAMPVTHRTFGDAGELYIYYRDYIDNFYTIVDGQINEARDVDAVIDGRLPIDHIVESLSHDLNHQLLGMVAIQDVAGIVDGSLKFRLEAEAYRLDIIHNLFDNISLALGKEEAIGRIFGSGHVDDKSLSVALPIIDRAYRTSRP